jgi:hypothetical protein
MFRTCSPGTVSQNCVTSVSQAVSRSRPGTIWDRPPRPSPTCGSTFPTPPHPRPSQRRHKYSHAPRLESQSSIPCAKSTADRRRRRRLPQTSPAATSSGVRLADRNLSPYLPDPTPTGSPRKGRQRGNYVTRLHTAGGSRSHRATHSGLPPT